MASVGQLYSKDFLYENPFIGHLPDVVGYIHLLQDIHMAMPNLEVMVEDCIGEECKVFTRNMLTGTIVRPTLGYPADNRVLSISMMGFWMFNPQGQLQGLCAMFDTESFRAQLGLQIRPLAERAPPQSTVLGVEITVVVEPVDGA